MYIKEGKQVICNSAIADKGKRLIDLIDLSGIYLTQKSYTTSEITLSPGEIKAISCAKQSFIFALVNENQTCLWRLNPPYSRPISIFYKFDISAYAGEISDTMIPFTISGTLTPDYEANFLNWESIDDFVYKGEDTDKWVHTNLPWNSLSPALSTNVYSDLPTLTFSVVKNIITDESTEMNEIVEIDITDENGEIKYHLRFNMIGNVASVAMADMSLSLNSTLFSSANYTNTEEQNNEHDGETISLNNIGKVTSYDVSEWEKLDRIMVLSLGDNKDTLWLFNNTETNVTAKLIFAA